MSIPTINPSVKLVHGKATTTSLKIAESFNKRHDTVLRAIQNMECSAEFRRRNFAESSYRNGQNKPQPMYTITRDGFSFLASGFTGKEAAQWKEKYIEAFNRLEQHALEKAATKRVPKALPPPPKTLPAIAGELQTRINKRAWELAHASYDEYRSRMMNHIMIDSGHFKPEDWPSAWEPLESSDDVLSLTAITAHTMEAMANSIRIRGRRLAKLVGKDFPERDKS